ncbi:MAG: T9SS type A sorting domain-containing protein [Fluviicola sp.]|nr:T9SS type A sorting domain-containing protein [Fluviicola sp.]
MKKRLLPFCFLAVTASAQQTIHSVSNGAATNPFIWDCLCFPTTDDIIYVDHQVTMDVDWAITSGGKIEVSAGASLVQDVSRQLLVDGAGSQLVIIGTAGFTDIAFTNGASGSNTGQFSVDRGLYFASGTTFTNSTTISGIDSLLTEGTFTNSGNFYAGNFLNTGTFTNTGHIAADSMGNTGTFNANGGYLTIATFGSTGTFNMANNGFMDVSGNWYNAGDFTIANGLSVFVGGNAYTGDTLGGSALLTNNGAMAVTGDFASSDDVNGSGDICVGNDSYNVGVISGTLDFCDATGSDFDLNLGTIAGTVTYCTSGCSLGITEETTTVSVYPNPASTLLTVAGNTAFETARFYTTAGSLVKEITLSGNAIDLLGMPKGLYLIELDGTQVEKSTVRVIVE